MSNFNYLGVPLPSAVGPLGSGGPNKLSDLPLTGLFLSLQPVVICQPHHDSVALLIIGVKTHV